MTASIATNAPPETVLEALIAALRRAAVFNRDAEVAPVAVLWPDGAGQWQRVMPRLRNYLPILTHGPYDPAARTGPAIWIRAALATLDQAAAGEPPIIYLPRIRKEAFRNVEEAPAEIQPLLYLQFRGTMWLQPNGKDWTLAAFLQNAQHGLGIKVDASEATRIALVGAAPSLLDRPVRQLRDHPGGIDPEFLNTLLISDLPRQILDWINDPAAARAALDEAQWSAFRQQLQQKYQLDVESDGPSGAARLLGDAEAGSPWLDVWNRFAEAPAAYPGVPAMLRGARPAGTSQPGLFGIPFSWPQDNEAAEARLRQALLSLEERDPATARKTLLDLERAHAPRRASVWARLGQAPLASALEHLAAIARGAADPGPAGDLAALQAHYTGAGWRIDAAALSVASAVSTIEDRQAVDAALSAVYAPWLWDTAERFQSAIAAQPAAGLPAPLAPPPGTCVIFADGLRYDLAARLTERLATDRHPVTLSSAIGPLPGVTPSAKPAQSPIADLLVAGPKLNLAVAQTGTTLSPAGFKKLLADRGWQTLAADETGSPGGVARAWTEAGSIDSYGHNHPHDLPRQAAAEIDRIAQRIAGLLQAGWRQVTVVTDHGWLWGPRPMPKQELAQHLTVERKGRCARLIDGVRTDLQAIPWCWDPAVAVAIAPGASCFEEGKRYEHGGLSPQECILPTIVVTGGAPVVTAGIDAVTWTGLRCVVSVTGPAGLTVDIRQRAADPGTSLVAQTRAVENGQARVLIEDDANEGLSALVVVLDGTGSVIAQQSTIVGGE